MKENKVFIGRQFDNVKYKLNNNGMATKTTIFDKRIKIGGDRNHDGTLSPIFLECKIKEINLNTETIFDGTGKIISVGDTKETINHKRISKYNILSISGESKYMSGQILNSISDLEGAKPQLKGIIKIWKEWHLNDMQPNCIHQTPFDFNVDNYKELAEQETLKCPIRYKYGSKWLIKELPEGIIKRIQKLFTNYEVV